MRDFFWQGREAVKKASKLAKQLNEKIPEAFPQVIDWKRIQKCVKKNKQNETVFG